MQVRKFNRGDVVQVACENDHPLVQCRMFEIGVILASEYQETRANNVAFDDFACEHDSGQPFYDDELQKVGEL